MMDTKGEDGVVSLSVVFICVNMIERQQVVKAARTMTENGDVHDRHGWLQRPR